MSNNCKQCVECGEYYNVNESIDQNNLCDYCRLKSTPCLECGATNEYSAETLCICSDDKDDCHGCSLWG